MKNEGLSQEFEGSLTVKSLNQWKNKIEIIGYKLETDNNQKNQQENTERQLKMIENKIFKQEMLENYNFKTTAVNICKLQESLQSLSEIPFDDPLPILETHSQHEIMFERQSYKNFNSKYTSNSDNKFLSVKSDVLNEKKLREEYENTVDWNAEIDEIDRRLHQDIKNRKDNFEGLVSGIAYNLCKCRSAVSAETSYRKEWESLYTKFINDLKTKLECEISLERQSRQAFEGNLVKLLERTCLNF